MSPRVETARLHIRFARDYTRRLLDTIAPEEWWRIPTGGVTHVGWQVGHLAFAEYRLVLERVCAVKPVQPELLPAKYLLLFGRESTALPDPALYPSVPDLKAVFDAIHDAVDIELQQLSDRILDDPPQSPHMLCKTKLECLHWCSHHEMLHAGQIGLLRRQLGQQPIW